MSCSGRREALVAYLDQELAASERAELEAHLAGCDACRLALEAQRRLTGALASLGAVEPPRDFEARFWARIARERAASAGWRERFFTRRLALALAGAAAVAVAAVLALRNTSEPDVVELQIASTPSEDYQLLEDPDLDVIDVVDALQDQDVDQDGEPDGDPG